MTNPLLLTLLLHTFIFGGPLLANLTRESGRMPLSCGLNTFDVQYQISFLKRHSKSSKFALLLAGSPANKYFGEDSPPHEKLAEDLRKVGYKVMEIKYPGLYNQPSRQVPQGFYEACYRQGFSNIKKHSAELYDAVVKKLAYDSKNHQHRLVGVGYSLGAVQLQFMALGENRKFDELALTGVLFGNVVDGCTVGLSHQRRELSLTKPVCEPSAIAQGMSFKTFLPYVQQVTLSGFGCCIEGSSTKEGCPFGVKSEYTSELNIENQPYLTASNITIFEGSIACSDHNPNFSGANPGQAKYIADARSKAGKDTRVFYYDKCGHDVLGCAKDEARKEMLRALAPADFQ